MIDASGLRLRQHRRNGDRSNYPPLYDLQTYECGSDVPCFAESSAWILVSKYKEFSKLSKELRPRHKENCYLLNRMFDPFFNSTTRVCNRALSGLYTVSESLIAEIRCVLDRMCSDEGVPDRDVLNDGTMRYKYHRGHPINRYHQKLRGSIENTLDFVLRADPAGAGGDEHPGVFRVYDPEINTQEKLREVLKEAVDKDGTLAHMSIDVDLSSASLQRMVNEYLKRRNHSKISFQQSDHNACPWCKTFRYAILQYSNEVKILRRKLEAAETALSEAPRPLNFMENLLFPKAIEDLRETIKTKTLQENKSREDMKEHNERDARIRKRVKHLGDYFKNVKNSLRYQRRILRESRGWSTLDNHGCMTHQDDMTKVDLPHFVVNASSDITRWRFDVNAHVSSVTNDAVIFSHQQGSGTKNASMIFGEILLSHLVSCRGKNIKIVVSDNASFGKNWLTTIALPQYFVDQGFTKIMLVIFLENNHGKRLADMLFGQFQSCKRRSVLLGIDDLLSEFEKVRRKSGNVLGLAVNPLSSINFSEMLNSLGYETSPPSEFGFVKRNIHFAGACAPGAKGKLPPELRTLLGEMLPDDMGMVRISTEPSGDTTQSELPYEHRYLDVPAAQLSSKKRVRGDRDRTVAVASKEETRVVVSLYQRYREKGNSVVSNRTAKHVDHNGLGFRKLNACPELQDTSKPLVKRAWPKSLLDYLGFGEYSIGQATADETLKCAPENLIVRRPVSYFCESGDDWKARYPPRNLLNAKFCRGPRETSTWIPTATYH